MFYPDEEKKPRVHLPGVMSDEGPVFNIEGILTIQSGSRAMCQVPKKKKKKKRVHPARTIMTGQNLQDEQPSEYSRILIGRSVFVPR